MDAGNIIELYYFFCRCTIFILIFFSLRTKSAETCEKRKTNVERVAKDSCVGSTTRAKDDFRGQHTTAEISDM